MSKPGPSKIPPAGRSQKAPTEARKKPSKGSTPASRAAKIRALKRAAELASPELKNVRKFTAEERSELVSADWKNPASFNKFAKKFKLGAGELVLAMKTLVGPRDFRRWRRQAEVHGHVKNEEVKKKSHRPSSR